MTYFIISLVFMISALLVSKFKPSIFKSWFPNGGSWFPKETSNIPWHKQR